MEISENCIKLFELKILYYEVQENMAEIAKYNKAVLDMYEEEDYVSRLIMINKNMKEIRAFDQKIISLMGEEINDNELRLFFKRADKMLEKLKKYNLV